MRVKSENKRSGRREKELIIIALVHWGRQMFLCYFEDQVDKKTFSEKYTKLIYGRVS